MTATKLINGKFVPTDPAIAEESPLLIRINNYDYATLMSSPQMEKELAVGFCFSEGIIDKLNDIAVLHHCGSGREETGLGRVVEIKLANNQDALPRRSLEVRSGCGICGRVMVDALCGQLSAVTSLFTISADLLFHMNEQMMAVQKSFKHTGSTHAAAVFDIKGKLMAHAEDLGRHNALDKVIGLGLIKKIPLAESVLILSGRTSYEMALKSLRAQIPIIASVSGTTSMAVQLTEAMDCTLIGFLRNPRMEIYTHSYRVKES